MAKPRSYKSAIGEATIAGEKNSKGQMIYFIEVELDTPASGLTMKAALRHLERLNLWVDGAREWLTTHAK